MLFDRLHAQARRLAFSVALLISLPLLAGAARAQEEVKLGALMDVTGPIANFMPALLAAQQLAVDEVNANGGILGGKKLRLVVVDTQGTEQGAVDAARKLTSVENVPIIVGPLLSGTVISAAGSVTIAAGVPLIAPTATSPAITTMPKNDMLFPHRTRPTPIRARCSPRWCSTRASRPWRSAMPTTITASASPRCSARNTRRWAARSRPTRSMRRRRPPTAPSLRRSRRARPQALVIIAYAGDSGLTIVKQALENDFFNTFIGTESIRDDTMIKQIGADNLKNFFGTAPTSPTDARRTRSSTKPSRRRSPA